MQDHIPDSVLSDPEWSREDCADRLARLAQGRSLAAYGAIVRQLSADHAFWRTLLPAAPEGSTCLVLESRQGAISDALSAVFSRLISVHATTEAAAVTRARLERRGRSNVLVEVASDMAAHTEAGVELSAIVGFDLENDPTGQWLLTGLRSTMALIAAAPRMLAPSGVLVLAANNDWSYLRVQERLGLRERTGAVYWHSMHALARVFHRAGLSGARWYVSRARLGPVLEFSTELRALEPRDGTRAAETKRRVGLKERVLESRIGAALWPSFLVIASASKPARSRLEETLDSLVTPRTVSGGNGAVIARRLIAGNQGTCVVIAGRSGSANDDVVVRIPNSEHGRGLAKVNADMLEFLGGTSFRSLVPRLLSAGAALPEGTTIESRSPGTDVIRAGRVGREVIEAAFDALRRFNEAFARPTTVLEAQFDAEVADPIRFVRSHCPAHLCTELEWIEAALRSVLVGERASYGIVHGDFKVGNLLFDEASRVTAIIDWDNARQGFVTFDLLQLVHSGVDANNRLEAYLEAVLPWRLPPPWSAPAEQAAAASVSERVFLALRVAYYFVFLRDRIDPALAIHPDWARQLVGPVIGPMKREIAAILSAPGPAGGGRPSVASGGS